MSVLYHLGKANVVADALSCMNMGTVSHVEDKKKDHVKKVHRLARLGVRLDDSPNSRFVVHNNSKSSLMVEVKSKKHLDPLLMKLKKSLFSKLNESVTQGGMLC